jgi:hypothetical protein
MSLGSGMMIQRASGGSHEDWGNSGSLPAPHWKQFYVWRRIMLGLGQIKGKLASRL